MNEQFPSRPKGEGSDKILNSITEEWRPPSDQRRKVPDKRKKIREKRKK